MVRKKDPVAESVVTEEELPKLSREEMRQLEAPAFAKEAPLYEKLANRRVRCYICQRYCKIADGKAGYCRTKVNANGTLYSTIWGVVSAANVDPIEMKPVFHYRPGTLVYSLGSYGCNFRCLFCQNWEIAYADGIASGGVCQPNMPPEEAVQLAIESGSQGMAWTYNEPAIWVDYALDCAKLAKKASFYTAYVTNGYATPEGLDLIGPYLDVYRVDIKSFSDDFYRKLIKVPRVQGILDVAKRAQEKWKIHVEAVTNVIPGWNDDEDNLRSIARWIRENLGDLTPWHVTRFFPYAQMAEVPPTPVETLERAVEIGRGEGLKFVYLGNVATKTGQNTYCPRDHKLAIQRTGYQTKVLAVTKEGKCQYDGTDLNIVMG